MTEATVERIARLMHATFLRWREDHGRSSNHPWETLPCEKQEQYRATARAVLKALGH